jgi:hypothetical protein
MTEMRNKCNILDGKCEGMKSLGRPRNEWKDSIKVDF